MKRRNVRTLSLIIVTFTYLLVGAAIFDYLEGDNNEKAYKGLEHIRDSLIKKYKISDNDYKVIEVLMEERKPHKSGPQWKFAGSLYFAFVSLALIGYGHSTPATKPGKMFTVAYCTLGIPLAMIMFQSIGERMNKGSSMLIRRTRMWLGCRQQEATEADLILSSLFFSFVAILCGAGLYSSQEPGWDYFQSLYYCFITLTTIGFGDFVALQQEHSLTRSPGYVVTSFCFLLWGLSAVASSVNLLVLKFMTISLEEEQHGEDELNDVGTNVVTLDEEVLASNGRGGGMYVNPLERDDLSVCSCTCYSARRTRTGTRPKKSQVGMLMRILARLGVGREREVREGHYYDSETQSISNYTKLAVKRSSF